MGGYKESVRGGQIRRYWEEKNNKGASIDPQEGPNIGRLRQGNKTGKNCEGFGTRQTGRRSIQIPPRIMGKNASNGLVAETEN